MSSMMTAPPPRIPIGGGPGGPGAPGAPGAQKGPDGPDSQQVTDLINQAVKLLRQAEDLEGDASDQALIANAVAQLRKFVGAQQALGDQAMGAGPGVKLVRKNTPPSGPSGGGY